MVCKKKGHETVDVSNSPQIYISQSHIEKDLVSMFLSANFEP